MAPAGKALGFYNVANDWFCNAGLPSDLTVAVDGVNFHLHKFPLLSRSGKIEKLIKETQNNDKGTCFITLEEIPGGTNGFMVAVKFCYGVPVELTPRNVVMVYFLADHLEMTDVYGDDNLLSKVENYFHKNVLKNWKDCMVALQNCETFVTKADDSLHIISKCLNAMSTMVCTDSSLFGWPMMMYGRLQSPGGSILWNGIDTGARIPSPESDWWFDDASRLGVALFERFVKTLEAKGVQPEKLTGAIMYYCGKCLHGLGRWQSGQITKTKSIVNFSTKSDLIDQRFLLETIVELLPQTKGKSVCRFLLGLLRVGFILGVNNKCQDLLERRIGMQLDLATLDGLMIPSYSDSDTLLYNTECVERIINYFLVSEEMGSTPSSSYIQSRNVSKLVDSYMAEIASDVNLKPEKLHSLAQALPESSRSLNDGLYRAVDIYFEAHPWLPEKEKEHLCHVIDCKKLSVDACAHASQNKRLPLRFVLQVLFFEQIHMKTALSDCLSMLNTENTPTGPMAIVPRCSIMDSERDAWVSLVRENQGLRVEMDRMMATVHELEEELGKMRLEIKRMS